MQGWVTNPCKKWNVVNLTAPFPWEHAQLIVRCAFRVRVPHTYVCPTPTCVPVTSFPWKCFNFLRIFMYKGAPRRSIYRSFGNPLRILITSVKIIRFSLCYLLFLYCVYFRFFDIKCYIEHVILKGFEVIVRAVVEQLPVTLRTTGWIPEWNRYLYGKVVVLSLFVNVKSNVCEKFLVFDKGFKKIERWYLTDWLSLLPRTNSLIIISDPRSVLQTQNLAQ